MHLQYKEKPFVTNMRCPPHNEYLSKKLQMKALKDNWKSFDTVGDIAIIKIPPQLKICKKSIAEAVMTVNQSIKTVLNQVSPVTGPFRLRQLEHVLGEEKTITIHREYGCQFKVDLASVFFSPRLSYERMRIANLVNPGETVINMFAGIGCYSIMIAKHRPIQRVYSIDLNPNAVELMKENARLNHVEDKVTVIEGDAQDIIQTSMMQSCDRVLMPLPEKAYEYLESAIHALKKGNGVIHYYDVIFAEKGENPVEKVKQHVERKLMEITAMFNIPSSRIVRMVGPRRYQIVLDIHTGVQGSKHVT